MRSAALRVAIFLFRSLIFGDQARLKHRCGRTSSYFTGQARTLVPHERAVARSIPRRRQIAIRLPQQTGRHRSGSGPYRATLSKDIEALLTTAFIFPDPLLHLRTHASFTPLFTSRTPFTPRRHTLATTTLTATLGTIHTFSSLSQSSTSSLHPKLRMRRLRVFAHPSYLHSPPATRVASARTLSWRRRRTEEFVAINLRKIRGRVSNA